MRIHGPVTRWRKSTQFRRICLFTLDSTQEIYIPSNSQKASLQRTHVFSLEVRMLEGDIDGFKFEMNL